jgi:4a-hydroxytetrahydrobiopterin dehydratase
MNKLHDMKCSSCNGNTPKLTNDEIYINLNILNNWEVNKEKNMIFKKIIFKNFKKSLFFANLVGKISEEESHHPDISIGYGYCLIMTHTHSIKGLSINDMILASKIDLIDLNKI